MDAKYVIQIICESKLIIPVNVMSKKTTHSP